MPSLLSAACTIRSLTIALAFCQLTTMLVAQDADWVPPPVSPAPVPSYGESHAAEKPVRYAPWGNGHIVIADPADYPRIKGLDVNSGGLFDTMRPNLFGMHVTDEWDFYNLINTDRSDFTDSPYSAGKGVTIMESGYTFLRNNDENLHTDRKTLPEYLTRIGITDEFEVRMKWLGYSVVNVDDRNTGLKNQYAGTNDLQVGFKYEVMQQDGWRPLVTVLGETFIPTGSGGLSGGTMQPRANMVWGWGLRRWLYLKSSVGVDWTRVTDATSVINGGPLVGPVAIHGADNVAVWHESVSLLYQATKRVGGFVEWYTLFSNTADDNRAQHYADTGLFIYATPNVQFDVRIGKRISDRVDSMFTGVGVSLRF